MAVLMTVNEEIKQKIVQLLNAQKSTIDEVKEILKGFRESIGTMNEEKSTLEKQKISNLIESL